MSDNEYSVGQSDTGEIILKNGDPIQFDELMGDLNIMTRYLKSIRNNNCCGPCREAGLVANHALVCIFGE